ncbi:hypothetical protein GFM02_34950, partial [Rhizobium leguminosarum bv. viciae]|nr:hypothetical protein [Rhizobium leguminosarum bv. viciae]
FQLRGDTVCLHRGSVTNLVSLCRKSSFSDSRPRCTPYFERFGLANPAFRGASSAKDSPAPISSSPWR